MGTIECLSKNAVVKFKGEIAVVVGYQHVKPGKGGAFVKTKLKFLKTGSTVDHTFHDGNDVEAATVERRSINFLYQDDEFAHFMDAETYEQMALDKGLIGDPLQYMAEGQKVIGVFHEGTVIVAELPKKIKVRVTNAPEGARGDTASGTAMKDVELETGATASVPVFIKTGDLIAINTEDGSYAERVSE